MPYGYSYDICTNVLCVMLFCKSILYLYHIIFKKLERVLKQLNWVCHWCQTWAGYIIETKKKFGKMSPKLWHGMVLVLWSRGQGWTFLPSWSSRHTTPVLIVELAHEAWHWQCKCHGGFGYNDGLPSKCLHLEPLLHIISLDILAVKLCNKCWKQVQFNECHHDWRPPWLPRGAAGP